MYNTLLFVALLATTAISGVFAEFSIDTPKFTQCQPATISWSSGQGPYHLVIVDTNVPCGDVILDVGDFKETSISWTVQLPESAAVTLYVEDSGTEDAWSGPIHVLASNDQTCIPASVRRHYKIPDSSSNSTTPAGHGTLVITPTNHVTTNNSPTPVPVGAANAGSNPLQNGALSLRHVCTPFATVGVLIAATLLIL